MSPAIAALIRECRHRAGFSQRELAERASTSQPAVARLESGLATPTFETLQRLLHAAGFELHLDLKPIEPTARPDPATATLKLGIDRSLIARNLAKSVAERIGELGDLQEFGNAVERAAKVHPRRELTRLQKLLRALHDENVEFIVAGGVAARASGSAHVTQDLDVSYARNDANLARLVRALRPLKPYLLGASPGLPFEWSADTLRTGLNFTLTTTAGDINLLGEITGGGSYENLLHHTIVATVYGRDTLILNLEWLIKVKRAAGRPRDLEVIAELEVIRDELAGNRTV
jgi:transcriptional regulator with XRE-family HTH domain